MINVVIPTFNAETYIDKLLHALRSQSVDCEVLLIDSSSTDGTLCVAAGYDIKTSIIKKTDFNHGKARNLGAQACTGDIVVFLTQDALPCDDQCIENLIRPLDDPRIVGSYARQIPYQDAPPPEKFARLFNYPNVPTVKGLQDLPKFGIKTFFFSNVCSAIKIKEFKELGEFPENIVMFEDMIFAAKAILHGYKIAYTPEAKVFHSHDFSLKQQFQRYLEAGVSLRNNNWLLRYATGNSEGVRFLKEEILYLSKRAQYRWIPYILAESVGKYMGYWLGLHYDSLPDRIRKNFVSYNNA